MSESEGLQAEASQRLDQIDRQISQNVEEVVNRIQQEDR